MFEKGSCIDTPTKHIIIKKLIERNSWGDVYSAIYADNNQECILRWFLDFNDNRTYDHYSSVCEKISQEDYFIKTEVVKTDYGFGMVSDIPPNDFCSLEKIIFSGKPPFFENENAKITFCINLVEAFNNLNCKDLCYYVFEPEIFFVNYKTGDLIITNCEFITQSGVKLYSHAYSPSVEAPEIVTLKQLPSGNSNLFSVLIFIFLVLFGGHPFRGKKYLERPLATYLEERIEYGENAVFVFDIDDKSNYPLLPISRAFVNRWDQSPQYLRNLFLNSFGRASIKNPSSRVNYAYVLEVLLKYKRECN